MVFYQLCVTFLNEINQNGKKFTKHCNRKDDWNGSAFFKVEDLYESYFEKDFVRPIKSIRDIYEGGYIRNLKRHLTTQII